jgi:hypothetical protein
MLSHRTTARGAFLLILAALVAAAFFATPASPAKKVPQIVFPLIGDDIRVDDNYGDPRVNGSHAAIDMMAPRRTPVVAVEDGRIKWWTTSARAGCMLYLYGASGTTYLYIHLNNDRGLTNDNKGGCVAGTTYVAKDDAKVRAGELIAWNGDSGDADGNPHLHFEVHPDDGPDVNPFPYLMQATRLLFPARLGARFTVGLRGTPVAAGGGTLTLRVSAVRWWPGGRWTTVGSRVVKLGVAKGARVDAALAPAVERAESRTLASAAPPLVTAFTVPARATAEALRGEPGALVAARVTRPGGTLVETEPGDDADEEPIVEEEPASSTEGFRPF